MLYPLDGAAPAHGCHPVAQCSHVGSSIVVRECEQACGGAIRAVERGDFLEPERLDSVDEIVERARPILVPRPDRTQARDAGLRCTMPGTVLRTQTVAHHDQTAEGAGSAEPLVLVGLS
jgi:hypothetical protein